MNGGHVRQVFEKRALKARIPLQNFIGCISEESTHWSRGHALFAQAANGGQSQIISMPTSLAGKVRHDNNFNAAFKAHSVQEELRISDHGI